MEDSGNLGINDFSREILPCQVHLIYNNSRIGQMKSIENGLQFLRTPFVFHCEEDWEFYDYGFIEKSFEILNQNPYVTSVWLRAHNELRSRYNFPIIPVTDWICARGITDITPTTEYYIIGPNTGNFSWNPGLKTLKVAMMFSPYTKETLPTSVCEGGLSVEFRKLGMVSAITSNKNGYVKHIGWNEHVY